ncbi:MAG: DEAD/DEAH box helicase [Actinomycetales bacterium]|uniref:DEAD/DEAH box helicase n=1 Tax=Candidatus Phosphoribacter hodrii TaxID=2953743 RepID=A0A9D7T9A5_9MICO|nr:DEAD/DEAH box helicase [Candidatus Phosphoribacter hodrii]
MSELTRFAAGLDFGLDPFQVAGCEALEAGRGVLVAAPTGAGKTVVGEFAVHLALATGRKAFYTTPIKALSNQKYADLCRRHGAANVGLLTGDSSVNGEAPVVVMTTEVLRNMMYAGSPTLAGLGYVVMDEVHYLADRFRGAVWEEVIIHLPEDVLVVSLSATVSNAEEFGEWLGEVRGDVAVVVSEIRPVPLWQHVMVGKQLFDLFVEESLDSSGRPQEGRRVQVNPELLERIRSVERALAADSAAHRGLRGRTGPGGGPPGGGRGPRGGRGSWESDAPARGREGGIRPGGGPTRADVIATLDREGLLPAITFVFSRNGCDTAVGQLLARGIRLVSEADGVRNRRYVEERIGALADEDLSVLGYWDFVDGIERGFAAHHAGMLPTFREIVEELFTQGRVRAVFATETLALGINMPARTVVLEKLVKYNGDTHAELTPAEYTQLTGRAGRRGIDVEGHGVVLWSRGLDPLVVGGLASTRTYPLRSSFRPTYNMAVNLVAQVGRDRARELLETSFAQFQADRSVVGLAQSVRRGERQLAEYAVEWHCHLGDFGEYAALRASLRDLEKGAAKARSAATRAEAELSLERLRPGDVIRVPTGRRAGYAVVVAANRGAPGRPASPAVVTEDRQLRRLTTVDVPTPVQPLLTVRIPTGFNAKSPKSRRDLAATLRIAVAHEPPPRHTSRGADDDARRESDAEVTRLRAALREHPCHACPDREEHSRRAEKWWRLRRETDALARQVDGRTNTVARTFDRICDLLEDLGYLGEGGLTVTEAGQDLRQIYAERDLLAAQCIREGVWNRLDAAGLAAVVSALIHEPRREDLAAAPRVPTTDVGEALTAMTALWATLEEQERLHGLPPSGAPDAGIVWMVHRWASGQRLETVLRGSDLAAGDFVRRCKQVVDLLGQISDIAPHPALSAKARKAVDAVRRGVVAADRID